MPLLHWQWINRSSLFVCIDLIALSYAFLHSFAITIIISLGSRKSINKWQHSHCRRFGLDRWSGGWGAQWKQQRTADFSHLIPRYVPWSHFADDFWLSALRIRWISVVCIQSDCMSGMYPCFRSHPRTLLHTELDWIFWFCVRRQRITLFTPFSSLSLPLFIYSFYSLGTAAGHSHH